MGCCDERTEHPRTVLGWRAWADSGQTYMGREPEDFARLPSDGVLAVKVFYADGRSRRIEGGDWYFAARDPRGGPIYGSAVFADRPDPDRYRGLIVTRGRWVSDAMMEDVDAQVGAARWEG